MRIRLALMLLAGATFLAPAAPHASAAPKLAAPTGVSAVLNPGAVTVRWKPISSGRVEVKVRVKPATGKARSKSRSTRASKGRFQIHLPRTAGAAPTADQLSVRLRRCTTAKKPRCSRWTGALRPTTAPPPPKPYDPPAGPQPPSRSSSPTLAGCPMFPAGHALNQDVSTLPVDPRSDAYLGNIGLEGRVHPDFGAADLGQGPGGFGIPFSVVPEDEPLVRTVFGDYVDESDPGPYPIPLSAPIEGGPNSDGDRHVLAIRQGECKLYELGNAYPRVDHWEASGGAVWDLATGARSTGFNPGWTSVDAAGLPVLPALVRYDEVAAGEIRHAVRFTVARSQRAYIAPASHWASSITDQDVAPMGLRLRMRADYDLSRFRGQSLVIATALKRYGMIVADNGSNWYITGAADPRWDDEDLSQLKTIPGSAFEAVQTGGVVRP